jgi:hypothetical protein
MENNASLEWAAAPVMWDRLSTHTQARIWQQLLAIINGDEPAAHDQPELCRLAERTFRSRVERAFGNVPLLREFAADSPFWLMSRDELLEQDASHLRLWHRLLRPPKGQAVPLPYLRYVRSLRHAAGLIEATAEMVP